MKSQIRGGVVLSFVSQGIAILVGLVYMPLMVRMLGQNEYGTYQLVQSVVNYLNLMNFGFSGAYIRFFSLAKAKGDEEEIARLNGMFLRIFLLISLLCLLAGGMLVSHIHLLGEHLTEADYAITKRLMVILVVNLAVSFPSSVFTVYLSANEQFVYLQGINVLINILIPLLNLPLLATGHGSTGVVSVTLLLTCLRLVLNLYLCMGKLKMRFRLRGFDFSRFKVLLGFTFFIFLSDVVDQLNSNVDKVLLGRMLGTVPVAVYAVGYNLSTYYTILSWVIPEMFIPEANRLAIEEKDDEKLTEIFTRIGCYNNEILLLILTGFILVGKPFIRLCYGEGYELSYPVAVILMLAAYIPSIQTLGVNIQNAKNMHRPRSVIYFVVACVNVLVSIVLIRRWGVVGTALGTLGAVLLGTGVFMNLYYQRRIGLDVRYFWKKVIRWTALAAMLCLAVFLCLRPFTIDNWWKLGAVVIGYSCLYAGLLWKVGLRGDEKAQVISLFETVRAKMGRGGKA
ncbi:MAG: oligosaccharide flippase family protein [Clostridia bacterium]|nr:oligosaccharide flippase family protein [Clostridia bacterium]